METHAQHADNSALTRRLRGWRAHTRSWMLATAAFLFLLLLIDFVAADASAVSHRCLHSTSQALHSMTQNAKQLRIEFWDDENASTPRPLFAPPAGEWLKPRNRTVLYERDPRGVATLAARDAPDRPVDDDGVRSDALRDPFAFSSSSPIRIRFDVSHLHRSPHFCSAVGQRREDKLGGTITCTADDLFEAWKREFLVHRLLPLLSTSVEQWLRVRRVQQGRHSAGGGGGGGGRDAKEQTSRVVVPKGACGERVDIPASHSQEGVSGADMVVYVLAAPLHDSVTTSHARASASASSRTVAWATYCAIDRQTSRPLVAMMNFVPSALVLPPLPAAVQRDLGADGTTALGWLRAVRQKMRAALYRDNSPSVATAAQLQRRVLYANDVMERYYAQWTAQHHRSLLHELLHALGFAPTQLRRYSTTATLTHALPTPSRGAASTTARKGGAAQPPVILRVVNAPGVTAAVQEWTQCRSSRLLPGAALEQSGPEGTVGAHWERLLFRDDLMAGVLSQTAALSNMTLAFFDALPYYAVDRRFAEVPAWGHRAGCGFASEQCTALPRFAAFGGESAGEPGSSLPNLSVDTLARLKYWCEPTASSAAGHTMCTADRRAIGFCFAQQAARRRPSLPVSTVNSGAGTTSGKNGRTPSSPGLRGSGLSLLMEGCPVVEAYANRICDDSDMAQAGSGSTEMTDEEARQRRFLEDERGYYFGPYSRCFASSEVRSFDLAAQRTLEKQQALSLWGSVGLGTKSSTRGQVGRPSAARVLTSARCLQTRCVRGGAAVEVRIGSTWVACPLDGAAGVVMVPPTSGYSGWIGCENAALYCADAAQLQRPLRMVNATLPHTAETASAAALLPFYRVTVTFSMAFRPTSMTSSLTTVSPASSFSSASSSFPEAAAALLPAAALRAALVDSDRAFQAAVHRDLAQHRADLQLSPLGAVMGQRRVGAVRLTRASFALYAASAALQDPSNATAASSATSSLTALVSVDLEVTARNRGEAAAHTRSWLASPLPIKSPTPTVGEEAAGSSNDGLLAAVAFPATAEWLSRASCRASAVMGASYSSKGRLLSCAQKGGEVSMSPNVLPHDASQRLLGQRERTAASACWSGRVPVTWRVSVPRQAATLTVDGPLDVSQQGHSSGDLREVAVVHLRVRRADAVSAAVSEEAASGNDSDVSGRLSEAASFDGWLTQAATLLALSKDVGAALGVSAEWVRVATIRPPGRQRLAAPEATNGSPAAAAPSDAEERNKRAVQHVMEVAFVVSLPAFDELPRAEGNASRVNESVAPRPLTWPTFTERVRQQWRRQLRYDVAQTDESVMASPCLLRHTSTHHNERHFLSLSTKSGSGVVCLEECSVLLDAVLGVHSPRPGVSLEEVVMLSATDAHTRWWEKSVMQVQGFAMSGAYLLASVVTAALLVLCAVRYGSR